MAIIAITAGTATTIIAGTITIIIAGITTIAGTTTIIATAGGTARIGVAPGGGKPQGVI